MAEAKKSATGGARKAVSRATKIERRLGGIGPKTAFDQKSARFTVTGFAKTPVEIPGYIMDQTATHVLFRHRVTSASRKMKVSVFKKADVLELFGAAGEVSSITVLQLKAFTTVAGRVKLGADGSVTVITDAKETVNFPSNDQVTYEISALDEEGAAKKTAKAPSKKAADKEGKVVKMRKK